jgi:hypothetical protein
MRAPGTIGANNLPFAIASTDFPQSPFVAFAKLAHSRSYDCNQIGMQSIYLFIRLFGSLSIYLDCAPQTLPIRARIANSALNKNVWLFNLFAHNFNAPITTCSGQQEEMCKSNFYGVRLLKCTTNGTECCWCAVNP